MNSAAKDIVSILNGESSLGLTSGTDLFYSRMPDSPDKCVTCFDTPSRSPMMTYKQLTSKYYYSGVSVWARDIAYDNAYSTLQAILEFLHANWNITVGSTYYALIKALNEPQVLNYDKNDRIIMMVNFDVQRR